MPILKQLADKRIVEFWANNGEDPEYPVGMHITERCDTHFRIDLTKQEAQQMVDKLQELVNLIKD